MKKNRVSCNCYLLRHNIVEPANAEMQEVKLTRTDIRKSLPPTTAGRYTF